MHSGFPIRYNSDNQKTMDKTDTLCKLCSVGVLYALIWPVITPLKECERRWVL